MVSLYFVAGGEVCPGASIAALQQSVPCPSLSQKTHCPLDACNLKEPALRPSGAGPSNADGYLVEFCYHFVTKQNAVFLFCLALVILVSKSFVTVLFYFYSLQNSFHKPCVRVEPCFLCPETGLPVRVSVCSPLPCSK